VTQLSVREFRNLRAQSISLHPVANVFFGENAQGKTNALEALALVSSLSSFRSVRNQDLVSHTQASAQIAGRLALEGIVHDVALTLASGKRAVILDGKRMSRRAQWPSGASVVFFAPNELHLPLASPGRRRRFLDQAILGIWPAYGDLLRDYGRALANRNRLLKDMRRDALLMQSYEVPLVETGSRIIEARSRYIGGMAELFCAAVTLISAHGDDATLHYSQPYWPRTTSEPLERREIHARLQQQLLADRRRDLASGTTATGPHADLFEFRLAQRPASQVASQGQLRTMVLAFKLAQLQRQRAHTGEEPLVLLDDVSSELDKARSEQLFEVLTQTKAQLVLSTTRPELIPFSRENVQLFQVVNGSLAPCCSPP
jgi:DNA replication and repair protein RecF